MVKYTFLKQSPSAALRHLKNSKINPQKGFWLPPSLIRKINQKNATTF